MKTILTTFFEELCEKQRIQSELLNKGMDEREVRIIVYGEDAVNEVDEMMKKIETETADHPAMTLIDKSVNNSEPKQNS